MPIRLKLLLSSLTEILLIVVFSIFLIGSSRQMSQLIASETKAHKIVEVITEIRFVTFENLLHHDQRSYDQWLSKHTELGTLLKSFPATNQREKTLLDNIKQQQKSIEPIFNNLFKSYTEPVPQQNVIAQNQYQERLASQLVSKQQIKISNAFKLAALKQAETTRLRQQTNSLAVMVIVLMFLITAVNFLLVNSSISKALAILKKGADEIAKGRLGYRISYKRHNDELGRIASSFNNMAASLQQLDRVKAEFVLLVSHQLRTPATAVKGFLSLIEDNYSEGLSTKQRELLKSTYAENERQIELINQILVVAQVDTGEMILQKKLTNIELLAEEVVKDQSIVLKTGKKTVRITQLKKIPEIMVDTDKVRIVLENLVHNAIKYSPEGSAIEVKLRSDAHHVYIDVEDNGIGIAHDDIGQLFKKFSRIAEPNVMRVEGSGLGLYLAKKIIDLHQGDITLKSKVGEGTVFTVQLPNNTKDGE